ncbi:MAG: GHMP kinase, partial [Planctomycetota bacterium]
DMVGPAMIITTHAFARAGLVGNPSDGYFGKTISFVVRDFKATCQLWDSPKFEILPGPGDTHRYDSPAAFVEHANLMGYYGSRRLVQASIKRFFDYCGEKGHDLTGRPNFSVQVATNIPRLVGLSGSSAIITAVVRALIEFYEVGVAKEYLPTLILSVETQELGLAAGLQDRVAQVYEGLTYMDFDKQQVEATGHGTYESLRPKHLPNVYVAYDPERAEISDVTHRNLKAAWERGEQDVHDAMARLRQLTDEGKQAIVDYDMKTLHRVTNENFDIRRSIMPIAPENQKMIDVARKVGASAKFAGSGGAITGVFMDGPQYADLVDELARIRCTCLRPIIFDD